jgi:redox-sensing transcriptional repressor
MRPQGSQSKGRGAGSASLRRLPLYYRLLQQLVAGGVRHASSGLIGRDLGLDPTQVRKDLEAMGLSGRPRIGFAVSDLLRGIEAFLGWDRPKDAVLAGAGNLGSALLRYRRFGDYGVRIVAAFDTDPDKIGRPIDGKEVYLLDSLPGRVRRMGIHLGVIATPPRAAQRVADLMVEAGIRAVWNFAPVHLRLPPTVIVQNEDLGHALASLSLRLAHEGPEDGALAGHFPAVGVLEAVEPGAAQAGDAQHDEE